MTDVRTAGGGIPGEPGNWQIEDTWSSGDWGTRGSGIRAKFRFTATDSFFTAKPKNNGARKCSGPQKLLCPDPSNTLGAKLVRRTPILRGFQGSAKVPPESSLCRRLPPRELSAFSRAAEHGGFRGPCFGEMRRSGNREIWQRTERIKITEGDGRR